MLYIHLPNDEEILVGSLGRIYFKKGYYAYVGRARRGLLSRIRRHMRKEKKKRWHIDYFLEKGNVFLVSFFDESSCSECEKARMIEKIYAGKPIKGFGSSDCKCISHLIYLGEEGGRYVHSG